MKKHAIIPIFVPHIGCSESCVFCDQKQITARTKAPTLDEVRTTIDTWLTTLAPDKQSPFHFKDSRAAGQNSPLDSDSEIEIAFYGGSFTAIPLAIQESYLKVAYEYVRAGVVSGLHLSTRPDCITPEILDLLASYGVRTIELGVQSFDDQVLSKSKRGHDSETVRRACRMITVYRHAPSHIIPHTAEDAKANANINTNASASVNANANADAGIGTLDPCFNLGIQLMVGLPGDSLESCIYSAKEAVKLSPKFARIYPTLVLEGTELMDMYRRGEYTPLTRDQAISMSKAVYEVLDSAGVYIMRVGLKSTDIINNNNLGEINAGAYHPAFRQLVEGEIARDIIKAKLNCEHIKEKLAYDIVSEKHDLNQHADSDSIVITIRCSPSWISNAVGHNGANRNYFAGLYPHATFRFVEDTTLQPGIFEIDCS